MEVFLLREASISVLKLKIKEGFFKFLQKVFMKEVNYFWI